MDNFRKSMIEELMLTLKIPQGNFNFGTISDEIKHISNQQLRDFYKAVMSAETFGNGIKAIILVAKSYKPQEIDRTDEIAKEFYNYFYSVSTSMRDYADKNHLTYEDFCKTKRVPMRDNYSLKVAFEFGGKEKIININLYQTSEMAIKDIKKAIKRVDKNFNDATKQIANPMQNLQIKRGY